MNHLSLRFKIILVAGLGLTLAGGGAVWWQRLPLLAWYHVQCLSQAEEAERDLITERVLALDEPGIDALLAGLSQPDPRACANLGAALTTLGRRWGFDDPRWHDLSARLADGLDRASPLGQREILLVLAAGFEPIDEGASSKPGLAKAATLALARTAASRVPEVLAAALILAERLLEAGNATDSLADCRSLVQACLNDENPGNRVGAIRLAVHPGLGLLEQTVPLLHDASAEVRREAMTAVRLAPETVAKTDDLLRWLHDPDEDVRLLCEAVLTLRGMTKGTGSARPHVDRL